MKYAESQIREKIIFPLRLEQAPISVHKKNIHYIIRIACSWTMKTFDTYKKGKKQRFIT